MGAQELVQAARGRLIGRVWRTRTSDAKDDDQGSNHKRMASVDDISVLVIPLYPYLCEHRQWLKTVQQERQSSNDSMKSNDT